MNPDPDLNQASNSLTRSHWINVERYEKLTERLRRSEFRPDVSEKGNPTFQRWMIEGLRDLKVRVDFR